MHLDNYCPGCGGGAGNQVCAIARCSQQRSEIEYCYMCGEYPCKKYDGINEYDSFITHRNQLKDFDRVREIGLEHYQAELAEKVEILKFLLENYNDGRRKCFFCLAVNLLSLQDLKVLIGQIEAETASDSLTIKEKAALTANLFQAMAAKRNIVLKLNKKTSKG
jgi:hypothetical protein